MSPGKGIRTGTVIFLAVLALYSCLFAYVSSRIYARNENPKNVLVISRNGGDSDDYFRLSKNIYDHGVFSLKDSAPFDRYSFRTPGYPLLAGFFLKIFGSTYAVVALNFILIALTSCLIYRIFAERKREKLGIAAAFLYALDPVLLFYGMMYMTEAAFSFILVLAVYLLVRGNTGKLDYHSIVAIGLLLGFAALVRNIALYFIPIFVLGYIFLNYKNEKIEVLCQKALFMGLAALAVLLPWMIRNYANFRTVQLSAVAPYNMLFYNTELFLKDKKGIDQSIAQKIIFDALGGSEQDGNHHSLAFAKKETAVSRRLIGDDTMAYTAFHVMKSVSFFFGSSLEIADAHFEEYGIDLIKKDSGSNLYGMFQDGDMADLMRAVWRQWPTTLERIGWLVLFAGGVAAVVLGRKHRREHIFLLVLIVAAGILTGPVSEPRYRLQASALIIMAGLWGLAVFFEFVRRKWYCER